LVLAHRGSRLHPYTPLSRSQGQFKVEPTGGTATGIDSLVVDHHGLLLHLYLWKEGGQFSGRIHMRGRPPVVKQTGCGQQKGSRTDRKGTRLNSSHVKISDPV